VPTRGVAKPIKRLIADIRGGVIDQASAADLAVAMVQGGTEVPKRYRLGAVTEYDVLILGIATGASTSQKQDRSPASPQALSHCLYTERGLQCDYSGEHTHVYYLPAGTPGASEDVSEVPEYITRWVATSDAAWAYYNNTLEMTPTSSMINVYLQDAGVGSVCGSWPIVNEIHCGPDFIGLPDVDYFAAHEMFHQFQWPDVERALLSIYELNPWMESTANWASAHFAGVHPRTEPTNNVEASRIGAFFTDSAGGLVSRGEVTGSTMSGDRAYGAVAAAEILTQIAGDGLIKESFAAITSGTNDGLQPIDDALALHGLSLDLASDWIWSGLYAMCEPSGSWLQFNWCSDPLLTGTFSATGPGSTQTRRPTHETAWLASTPSDSTTFSLMRYGAGYIDFVLGSVPSGSYGTTLALEFDADQISPDETLNVTAWKDTPGGEGCQISQRHYPASSAGKTAFAIDIPTGCGYATLIAVNKHTGTSTTAASFPISWSSFTTGATIGNGTVTLGVNADGNLGLGVPRSWVCRGTRAQAAVAQSAYLDAGPALVLDATGYDAIRPIDQLCGPFPTEGWSAINPNQTIDGLPATFSKHGLDYPDEYPVHVTSFTYTDTEATSIVQLGDQYSLTQHWHPSSVDPRVYQLDVTIQATQIVPILPDPESLTYRQVVPLNITGDANTHPSVVTTTGGDGVNDATANLNWPWDDDRGSLDNPLVSLPHLDCDIVQCRGLVLDITVDPLPIMATPTPQFSMFYGFADSTGEAATILNDANATTRAIAASLNPETWEGDIALFAGYHNNTP